MRWGGIFDVDHKKIQIEEEELRTQAPDFWDNPNKAQEQLKKIATLKSWVNAYSEISNQVEELKIHLEFFKEGEVTEKDVDQQAAKTIKLIEELELKNMLRKEEDALVHTCK